MRTLVQLVVMGSSTSAWAQAACRIPASDDPDVQPPLRDAPADPWLAVSKQEPAVSLPPDGTRGGSHANVRGRTEVTPCDAAHDHCLRDCTWMVLWKVIDKEPIAAHRPTQLVVPGHRRPDGKFTVPPHLTPRYDTEGDYEALRTVPATRRLLRPGVRVVVLPDADKRVPIHERDALGPWIVGKLLEVDWDQGVVSLERAAGTYPLSAVRVVVLTYRKGGVVELAPGLSRPEIIVKRDEVLAPRP